MTSTDTNFEASDGAKIFVRTYQPPAGVPTRAALHVHHGLGEHCVRYADFATHMAKHGFLVVTFDARGHGVTATLPGATGLGVVEAGDEGVVGRMVKDLSELLAATRAARPGLRVLLMGHSFGTVISQICAGAGACGPLAGLILCAPPARIGALMAPVFRMLMTGLRVVHGMNGVSEMPGKLSFSKFQSKCLAAVKHDGPVTGWEWLNRDKQQVQAYIDDPLCGFDQSMGFWCSAVPAILSFGDPRTLAALPADLPVCITVGDHDFCSVDDSGVRSDQHISNELRAASKTPPKVIVYPMARHELLHEENCQEVTNDMLAFMQECLAKTPASNL